jgi:hypothetical protein
MKALMSVLTTAVKIWKGLDYLNSLPGEFPYVRGNKKTGNDWFIRQDIYVKDFI